MSALRRLAIVGSGPAGFYTAARVLGRSAGNVAIDMFESLPIPHGLVRYGVAPDHPEVKIVINRFDEVATNPHFRFFGNVTIGQDVSVAELAQHYDGIVLAYGASQDKTLGLDQETTTKGVLSARSFVGWYNGHPDYQDLDLDLTNTDTAVVVGHGNVALDVARVLLSPIDRLATTDITAQALDTLRTSRIRHVHLLGRRGPLQVQFTTKELREMFSIANLALRTDLPLLTRELERGKAHIASRRPLKRLLDLLYKQVRSELPKTWSLDFLTSPQALVTAPPPTLSDPALEPYTGTLTGLTVCHNTLEGPVESPRAIATDQTHTIETGLLLRSIGYRSEAVDPSVPFDTRHHIVPNSQGRVDPALLAAHHCTLPLGMYVSGWLKRGPSGVIVSTMSDAFETAEAILSDIDQSPSSDLVPSTPSSSILELLRARGKVPVTYADWKRIEKYEFAQGQLQGKPREKLTRVEDMLQTLQLPSSH
ncbi:hypothetical protein BJ085DRAFT_43076 [Dimargaris cristalligena]|uniref:NADPH:adrenodoxin oxidoreductase, mitochondrial n=1 Tax=Dimargaris cristalligena TaxID=215637 RepID=A0A4Q0A1B0_9FUNG|nr:hypothetical protein BJ085DRAFT_43076 [Dimargaris cristalligena]|eukprot:RKP39072.1 hypothetical protein BJ085DRAFT_43076 [Dimargaris cristalligena]